MNVEIDSCDVEQPQFFHSPNYVEKAIGDNESQEYQGFCPVAACSSLDSFTLLKGGELLIYNGHDVVDKILGKSTAPTALRDNVKRKINFGASLCFSGVDELEVFFALGADDGVLRVFKCVDLFLNDSDRPIFEQDVGFRVQSVVWNVMPEQVVQAAESVSSLPSYAAVIGEDGSFALLRVQSGNQIQCKIIVAPRSPSIASFGVKSACFTASNALLLGMRQAGKVVYCDLGPGIAAISPESSFVEVEIANKTEEELEMNEVYLHGALKVQDNFIFFLLCTVEGEGEDLDISSYQCVGTCPAPGKMEILSITMNEVFLEPSDNVHSAVAHMRYFPWYKQIMASHMNASDGNFFGQDDEGNWIVMNPPEGKKLGVPVPDHFVRGFAVLTSFKGEVGTGTAEGQLEGPPVFLLADSQANLSVHFCDHETELMGVTRNDFAQPTTALMAAPAPVQAATLENNQQQQGAGEDPMRKIVQLVRAKMIGIYERHNPDKLGEVDKFLEKYQTTEIVLYRKLCTRYGEAEDQEFMKELLTLQLQAEGKIAAPQQQQAAAPASNPFQASQTGSGLFGGGGAASAAPDAAPQSGAFSGFFGGMRKDAEANNQSGNASSLFGAGGGTSEASGLGGGLFGGGASAATTGGGLFGGGQAKDSAAGGASGFGGFGGLGADAQSTFSWANKDAPTAQASSATTEKTSESQAQTAATTSTASKLFGDAAPAEGSKSGLFGQATSSGTSNATGTSNSSSLLGSKAGSLFGGGGGLGGASGGSLFGAGNSAATGSSDSAAKASGLFGGFGAAGTGTFGSDKAAGALPALGAGLKKNVPPPPMFGAAKTPDEKQPARDTVFTPEEKAGIQGVSKQLNFAAQQPLGGALPLQTPEVSVISPNNMTKFGSNMISSNNNLAKFGSFTSPPPTADNNNNINANNNVGANNNITNQQQPSDSAEKGLNKLLQSSDDKNSSLNSTENRNFLSNDLAKLNISSMPALAKDDVRQTAHFGSNISSQQQQRNNTAGVPQPQEPKENPNVLFLNPEIKSNFNSKAEQMAKHNYSFFQNCVKDENKMLFSVLEEYEKKLEQLEQQQLKFDTSKIEKLREVSEYTTGKVKTLALEIGNNMLGGNSNNINSPIQNIKNSEDGENAAGGAGDSDPVEQLVNLEENLFFAKKKAVDIGHDVCDVNRQAYDYKICSVGRLKERFEQSNRGDNTRGSFNNNNCGASQRSYSTNSSRSNSPYVGSSTLQPAGARRSPNDEENYNFVENDDNYLLKTRSRSRRSKSGNRNFNALHAKDTSLQVAVMLERVNALQQDLRLLERTMTSDEHKKLKTAMAQLQDPVGQLQNFSRDGSKGGSSSACSPTDSAFGHVFLNKPRQLAATLPGYAQPQPILNPTNSSRRFGNNNVNNAIGQRDGNINSSSSSADGGMGMGMPIGYSSSSNASYDNANNNYYRFPHGNNNAFTTNNSQLSSDALHIGPGQSFLMDLESEEMDLLYNKIFNPHAALQNQAYNSNNFSNGHYPPQYRPESEFGTNDITSATSNGPFSQHKKAEKSFGFNVSEKENIANNNQTIPANNNSNYLGIRNPLKKKTTGKKMGDISFGDQQSFGGKSANSNNNTKSAINALQATVTFSSDGSGEHFKWSELKDQMEHVQKSIDNNSKTSSSSSFAGVNNMTKQRIKDDMAKRERFLMNNKDDFNEDSPTANNSSKSWPAMESKLDSLLKENTEDIKDLSSKLHKQLETYLVLSNSAGSKNERDVYLYNTDQIKQQGNNRNSPDHGNTNEQDQQQRFMNPGSKSYDVASYSYNDQEQSRHSVNSVTKASNRISFNNANIMGTDSTSSGKLQGGGALFGGGGRSSTAAGKVGGGSFGQDNSSEYDATSVVNLQGGNSTRSSCNQSQASLDESGNNLFNNNYDASSKGANGEQVGTGGASGQFFNNNNAERKQQGTGSSSSGAGPTAGSNSKSINISGFSQAALSEIKAQHGGIDTPTFGSRRNSLDSSNEDQDSAVKKQADNITNKMPPPSFKLNKHKDNNIITNILKGNTTTPGQQLQAATSSDAASAFGASQNNSKTNSPDSVVGIVPRAGYNSADSIINNTSISKSSNASSGNPVVSFNAPRPNMGPIPTYKDDSAQQAPSFGNFSKPESATNKAAVLPDGSASPEKHPVKSGLLVKEPSGLSLGGAAATTASGGGLFGNKDTASTTTSGGSLFGKKEDTTSSPKTQGDKPTTNGTTATTAPAVGGGLFGASSSTTEAKKEPATTAAGGSSLFGAGSGGFLTSASKAVSPVKAATTTATTEGKPAATPVTSSLFGGPKKEAETTSTTTGSTTGLFGATAAAKAPAAAASTTAPAATPGTSGLFGTPAPASGGGLFGAGATTTTTALSTAGAAATPAMSMEQEVRDKVTKIYQAKAQVDDKAKESLQKLEANIAKFKAKGDQGLVEMYRMVCKKWQVPEEPLQSTVSAPTAASTATATASTPQPAASAGGLFGATTPQQPASAGGLFGGGTTNTAAAAPGAPAGSGLFGQPQAAAAATPAAPGGGLFGQSSTASTPAPAAAGGGLFGNSNTRTLGTAGAASGLGAPAASPFGQQQAGSGLFGGQASSNAANNTPSTGGGGLFGNNTTNSTASNTGGGLFGGNNNTAASNASPFSNNTNNNAGGSGLFGNNNQGQQQQQQQGSGLFGGNNNTNNSIGSNSTGQPSGSIVEQAMQIAQQIYQQHNPSKMNEIPQQLEKRKGAEQTYINTLCKKYNINPIPQLVGGQNNNPLGQNSNSNTSGLGNMGSMGGSLFGGGNSTNNNNNSNATSPFGAPTGGSGLFGGGNSNSNNTNNSGGGLFGGGGNNTNSNTNNSGGGLFGGGNTNTTNNNNAGGGLFGGGGNTNTNTNNSGGGLFGGGGGNTGAGISPFSNNNNAQALSGGNTTINTTQSPWGGGTTNSLLGGNNSNTGGGGLFGGNTNAGGGNTNTGGGLFGGGGNNSTGGFGGFGSANNTNNSTGGFGGFGGNSNNNNSFTGFRQ